MKTTAFGMYALRLSFGQASSVSTPAASKPFPVATSPDRIVTRSATMLAVIGIALSSFSLKQMLANSGKKTAQAVTLC